MIMQNWQLSNQTNGGSTNLISLSPRPLGWRKQIWYHRTEPGSCTSQRHGRKVFSVLEQTSEEEPTNAAPWLHLSLTGPASWGLGGRRRASWWDYHDCINQIIIIWKWAADQTPDLIQWFGLLSFLYLNIYRVFIVLLIVLPHKKRYFWFHDLKDSWRNYLQR